MFLKGKRAFPNWREFKKELNDPTSNEREEQRIKLALYNEAFKVKQSIELTPQIPKEIGENVEDITDYIRVRAEKLAKAQATIQAYQPLIDELVNEDLKQN